MSAPELTERAAESLSLLGNFGPTTDASARTVKGYATWGDGQPGKVYLTSAELREFAAGLVEAADYLDARAVSLLCLGGTE